MSVGAHISACVRAEKLETSERRYAIGGAAAMARYFEVMAGEIGEKTHCEQNGIDQVTSRSTRRVMRLTEAACRARTPITCGVSTPHLSHAARSDARFLLMRGVWCGARTLSRPFHQGMHNVLVNAALADWAPTHGTKYTGLPSFVSHTNERGPVYTGGYAPKGVYSQTKEGVFLNGDGDAYRVLHQYDRHVYMTEALAAVVSRLGAAGPRHRVPLQQPPAAAAAAVAQVSTVIWHARASCTSSHTVVSHRHQHITARLEFSLQLLLKHRVSSTVGSAQVSTAAADKGERASQRRALVFIVQLDPVHEAWCARKALDASTEGFLRARPFRTND